MTVTIQTGESTLTVFYRLNLPGKTRLVVGVAALDVPSARNVLGNATEDYSLIIPYHPRGYSWPFVRGYRPELKYVEEYLNISGTMAGLIRHLIPILVTLPPADEVADAADQYLINNPF